MAPLKLSYAYIITVVIFLAILVFGTYILNWGQTHYAFVLIIFFLVLLGIRLDEIAQQIREVKTLLHPEDDMPVEEQGHLAGIRSTLISIHQTLKNLESLNPPK
jgi:dolichol kinase